MFDRFKEDLGRLLLTSVILLALLAAALYSGVSSPRTRISIEAVANGVAAGIGLTAIVLITLTILRFWRPSLVSDYADRTKSLSLFSLLGAAFFTGTLEELVLRGYAFRLLQPMGDVVATLVILVLTACLYFRSILAVRLIESVLLCILWTQHRSVVVVGIAHGICELTTRMYIRHELVDRLLSTFVERGPQRKDFRA